MSEAQLFDTNLEQLVLGCLLTDNALLSAMGEVTPEIFNDPVHADIYSAILARVEDGQFADSITLRFAMRDHDGLKALGGVEYLIRLQSSALGIASFRDYARNLRDLYGRRMAVRALTMAKERLERHDEAMTAQNALELAEADLSVAMQSVQDRPLARAWIHGVHRAVTQMNDAYQNEKPPGVSTGLAKLDKIITMGKGDLILLGGRPSMGKSAIALNIAVRVALRGEGVFFGSLEMGEDQLAERAISQILAENGRDLAYSAMRKGDVDEASVRAVLEISESVSKWPIYTCDPSCRSLTRLRGAIQSAERQFIAQGNKLSLIVIDYMQLVEPTGRYRPGDTNGRVSAASEAMKAMARHYDVPVLCLSQLNRAVEMRDPPVPMLSDLRDSGSIEQDADVVMFAYRPEYYTSKKIEAAKGAGKTMAEMADLEAQIAGQRNRLSIIVAKNRHGAPGAASLYCDVARNVIADSEPRQFEMEGLA